MYPPVFAHFMNKLYLDLRIALTTAATAKELSFFKLSILLDVSCKRMSQESNLVLKKIVFSVLESILLVMIHFALIFTQEAHGPHRSPEKIVQINKHI